MSSITLTAKHLTEEPVEQGISWFIPSLSFINFKDRKNIATQEPLRSKVITSYSTTNLYTSATNQLIAKNFSANVTGNILGIKVSIDSNRVGRITDKTIQLTYQNEPIGNNKAIVETVVNSYGLKEFTTGNNIQTYGSETDTWNANLTQEIVNDESFGIIIQFASHPFYPHTDFVYIDSISLEIFYE